MTRLERIESLKRDWAANPRWAGIKRTYTAEQVVDLMGSFDIEYTLCRRGATRFWDLLNSEEYVDGLGALTGNQAIQEAEAGLKAIYLSGWQVAADANLGGEMYPDQSLYPANSVPNVVKRINNALMRADQIQYMNGGERTDYMLPIIADAEAGFGGNLNAYELTKSLIEAGAAACHFEDQLSSAKKCGHLGGKVLVPTQEAINKLAAARLAADVAGVPMVIIARTDADAANLITSDIDARDLPFIIEGERTAEGFFRTNAGIEQAIARGLAYAPYADLIWCETSKPSLEDAQKFADAIHAEFPDKLLAYNCSPSFNWSGNLDKETMRTFREQIAAMGYKFQFITLAGFHALNTSMYELARAYRAEGMLAYSRLQDREFELEKTTGYRAVKHQAFVGAGYFDRIQNTVMAGESSTVALVGSTEEEQFH